MTDAAPIAQSPRRRIRVAFAVARGLALLLGTFALLNVLGGIRNPGFDANLWWIDLRSASQLTNKLVMVATGLALVTFAVRPRFSPLAGWGLSTLLVGLIGVAAMNWWTFHRLVTQHVVQSRSILPLSALVVVVLGFILAAMPLRRRVTSPTWLGRMTMATTIVVGAILFPLAQMFCFGWTDYRRPADVIVVFGCRVFRSGNPSMALADRVRTGVELYHAGFADRLVFSGGPGDGDIHETEAMRTLAAELGVPESAMELDRGGLSTQETVHNLVERYRAENRQPRVLAVSNFYHLPRIKLCFRRSGWDVWTVPAKDSNRMYNQEWSMLREIAALWWYYLNPN